MIKKTLSVVLVGLVVAVYVSKTTHAQDFNFDKAYQDYVYSLTLHSQAKSDYEKAKTFYLANPTLTLKEDARKKTLAYVLAQDEILRVYLQALRMKIIEIKGLNSQEKDTVVAKLDSEIAWFKTHKEVFKEGDPLEDLFNKEKETESRYASDTAPIIYDALWTASYGEIASIRNLQEGVYKTLNNSINLGVSEGTLKIDPFNRWFSDIENMIKQMDSVNAKSKAKIVKLYDGSSFSPKSTYQSAIEELAPNTANLKQMNGFLEELLNTINSEYQNSK